MKTPRPQAKSGIVLRFNQSGRNGIRAQVAWLFKVSQPKDPDRPKGAYFTDIEPSRVNLRVLHKKIRLPRTKQEYVFWFKGIDGLSRLNGGLGRDKRIFYSAVDYEVSPERQRYDGATQPLSETFDDRRD